MGGLFGGGDAVDERIAGILVKVFQEYDIEPGELNERIEKTVMIIEDLAPIAKDMEDLTGKLEDDVSDLRDEVKEFNDNASDISESLDNLDETLRNFNKMIAAAAEEKEKEDQ